MISKKSLLVSAALTSLLAAPSAFADPGHTTAMGEGTMGQCHGVNACKGHGACKGAGHSCEGKNSCEGKGWLKMSKEMCEKLKDGKWNAMPKKS